MALDLGVIHHAERGSPYHVALGAKVVALDLGTATLTLEAKPEQQNHLGGPHAATLFGLAETAAAAVVISHFGDLIRNGAIAVIRSAEINYLAVAIGTVTALASFAADEHDVRQRYDERGRSTFPVDVIVTDAHGTQTTSMRAQMTLKSLG